MKRVIFGVCIGYALSHGFHVAQAGIGHPNLTTLAHLSTTPGHEGMDYRFNIHLGVESLDSTSPSIDQASWDALRSASDSEAFSEIMSGTPASEWWAERQPSEQNYFFENVQRMTTSR